MNQRLPTLSLALLFLVLAAPLAGPRWTEAKDPAIVIGASISLTGAYARLGEELKRGYETWQRDVNERGGLLSRRVEMKIYDDQSDPTTGVKLYEKLITADKVDLVMGPYTSAIGFAASTVTEKYDYPMIASGSSARNLWERGYKYLFQIYPQPEQQLRGVFDIARRSGVKTMALLTEDQIFNKELAQVAVKMAKDAGVSVVFYEEYGKAPADLSPLLLKAKARRPDMILGSTYLPESMLMVRQAKELGINPKVFVFTIGPAFPDFTKSLGKDAEFVVGLTWWEPTLKLPGVKEFTERFQKSYGQPPAYVAAGGFGGLQILEAAVKRVGSLDRRKIRDALATMEVKTVWGAYKVNEKGMQISHVTPMLQIQNGQKEIVWPDDVATAKLVFPVPEWDKRR